MNNTKLILSRIVAISGFALGAFALSVFATGTNTWVGPEYAPPDHNTDEPINVGSVTQWKDGLLGVVDMFITQSFTLATGTPVSPDTSLNGYVLTATTVGGHPGVGVWKKLDAVNCTTI